MKICTFFGHRDCPDTIKETLQKVLEDLITNHDVNTFYVGHQGQFDAIVYRTLQELKKTYTHIRVTVVLAYMPGKKTDTNHNSLFKSMLCEAKLPFLFSFLSYLFSGNDNLREERRTKREK